MKKAQFNFVWLFAIIAGATILILAIYGATKSGTTLGEIRHTETAFSLSVLTDPLQAGFADQKKSQISFSQPTRLNLLCRDIGFGDNRILVDTDSNLPSREGVPISIKDKYLFINQDYSKDYEVFSSSINMPYKIADILIINSQEFCLKNAPEDIERFLTGIGLENFKTENCSTNAKDVCFNSANCDIRVYSTCSFNCESPFEEGYVEKNGQKLYFIGDLLYAAIISEKDYYDCNLNRLFFKAQKVSEIYKRKADLMDARGCNTALKPHLVTFITQLANANPPDLFNLNNFAKEMQRQQRGEVCNLW